MSTAAEVITRIRTEGVDLFQRQMKGAADATARLGTTTDTVGVTTGRAHGRFARFGGGILNMAKGLPAVIGGMMLADKAINGLGTAVNTAADTGEEMSKSVQVFGAASAGVQAFAATSARSLGISRLAALQATGVFGNMLRPMGISQKQAANMSTSMVKLAADMASFNNASPEDTLEALRAGLTGETEPLRRFGVTINDAAIQQQALSMGLKKGKEPLTAAAKAQATYALIMKQTKLQQGDVARTGDSLANQKRKLAAQVSDLAGRFGTLLIPALTRIVTVMNERIVPALSKAWDWLDKNRGTVKAVAGVLGTLGVALGIWKTINLVKNALLGAKVAMLAMNMAMRANPIGTVITLIAALAAGLIYAYKNSSRFRGAVNKLWDVAKQAFGYLESAWDGVVSAANAAWSVLEPILNSMVKLFETAKAAWKWIDKEHPQNAGTTAGQTTMPDGTQLAVNPQPGVVPYNVVPSAPAGRETVSPGRAAREQSVGADRVEHTTVRTQINLDGREVGRTTDRYNAIRKARR